MTCSVAHCLDVVGEWWSLLIVRDAFLGVTRFDDFQARLGISRNILTQRLNHLVENDVLKRVAYSDHPPRSEYRLTAKGRDLWHVVTAMRQWGDQWAAPGGPPVQTRHTACGHVVTAVPACSHCGEPLDARAVTAVPGPGAAEGAFDRTRLVLQSLFRALIVLPQAAVITTLDEQVKILQGRWRRILAGTRTLRSTCPSPA
jgi:DNA-binding HxlR family transcriptional regulator